MYVKEGVRGRAALWMVATVTALAAIPAAAAPVVNYTTYTDEQLAAELDAKMKSSSINWCSEMEPLARQMETRGTFGDRIGALATYSNLVCAYDEERWDDAYRSMTFFERKWRQPLDFPMSILIPQKAGHADVAEARLIAFVDAAAPQGVTRRQSLFVWDFARIYAKAKQPERRIALFRQLMEPQRREKFDMLTVENIGAQLFKWEAEAGNIDAARAAAGADLARHDSVSAWRSALRTALARHRGAGRQEYGDGDQHAGRSAEELVRCE